MKNNFKDAFEPIQAEDEMKQRTKQLLMQEETKHTKKSRRPVFQMAIAFACLCVILAGSFQVHTTKVEAASIEMQGEARICLSLNNRNKVIKATGLNEAGTIVVEQVNVSGMPYEAAIEAIMSSTVYEEAVADPGAEVPLEVDAQDEAAQQEIADNAQSVCESYCRKYGEYSQDDQDESEHNMQGEHGSSQGSGNGQGNGNGQGSGAGQNSGSDHEAEGSHGGNGGQHSGNSSGNGGTHGNGHE